MNPVLSGEFSGGTAQRRKLRTSARRPSVPIPRGHPWPAGDALSQDTPLRHKHRARSSHEPTRHKTLLTRLSRALSLAGSTGFRCLRRASAPIAGSTRPAAADIAHDATSRQIHPQMERSPKKSSPCLARSNKCPSGQAAIRGRPGVARGDKFRVERSAELGADHAEPLGARSKPSTSIRHPARSGSSGVNFVSSAEGSSSSSRPRVSPRCSVQTTCWFSRTASR